MRNPLIGLGTAARRELLEQWKPGVRWTRRDVRARGPHHRRFQFRRTVRRRLVSPAGEVTIELRSEPWSVKGTQRPPWNVRADRRAANKRARASRKANR